MYKEVLRDTEGTYVCTLHVCFTDIYIYLNVLLSYITQNTRTEIKLVESNVCIYMYALFVGFAHVANLLCFTMFATA